MSVFGVIFVLTGMALTVLAMRRVSKARTRVNSIGWSWIVCFLVLPPVSWYWVLSLPEAHAVRWVGRNTQPLAAVLALFMFIFLTGVMGVVPGMPGNKIIPLLVEAFLWFSLPVTILIVKLRPTQP